MRDKSRTISRRETIKLLEKSGADMSQINETEIDNLRELASTIKSIGALNKNNKKNGSFGKKLRPYLAPITSAWGIWVFILFTLNAMEVIFIYDEKEWIIWGFFPPVTGILIYAWVKKFILQNKNNNFSKEILQQKNKTNISSKLLFNLCKSGANIFIENHGGFIKPESESDDLLNMCKDLDATVLLESIIHSFSLVNFCMMKSDKNYFSSKLSDKLYKETLEYLLQVDTGIYGDNPQDREPVTLRQEKALKHGVEVASHMHQESKKQTFKVLEAASILYSSKVFKNEKNQVQQVINLSKILIIENDKAIKNYVNSHPKP